MMFALPWIPQTSSDFCRRLHSASPPDGSRPNSAIAVTGAKLNGAARIRISSRALVLTVALIPGQEQGLAFLSCE
jgi:hypothetical protein